MYYLGFGKRRAGRPPVVLIHGSTGTGVSNWRLVAPLLAQEYRVIVPDCRGHGRSSNPHNSYSFREMADDVAALVRALGHERAHIIGHSNGGNVALVTLLEHPEVVQSAVLQAANAYVSPDLVEREPAVFDPERVAREDPKWMAEMITLHGPTHGPNYWRRLLKMTLQATISEPNYAPEDLASVERPTLVIQGEHDPVNAPGQHAQFIAGHIPAAELWIPEGVGHGVHDEDLLEWVKRVMDFLARRGAAMMPMKPFTACAKGNTPTSVSWCSTCAPSQAAGGAATTWWAAFPAQNNLSRRVLFSRQASAITLKRTK